MEWVYLRGWFICMLLSIITVSGLLSQKTSALEEPITETFESERLVYILDRIDKRYDISIRYNETLLPIRNLDFDFRQIPLKNVLSIILSDNNLDYLEYAPDKIIIIPQEKISREKKMKLINSKL